MRPDFSVKAALGALSLAVLLLAGCGGSEDVRQYDVSGEVVFRGKPVPAGRIIFEPDASQGNNGPQGVAEIKDGKYDTSVTGKGTIGGPHRVMIIGTDGVPAGEGFLNGKPLFPAYSETIDLPKKNVTHDFEVVDFSR